MNLKDNHKRERRGKEKKKPYNLSEISLVGTTKFLSRKNPNIFIETKQPEIPISEKFL